MPLPDNYHGVYTTFDNSNNSDLLAAEKQATKAFAWARAHRFFDKRFVSKQQGNNKIGGTDGVITEKTELVNDKGLAIRVRLRAPITHPGRVDDNIMEGNEQKLSYFTDVVAVHQRRQAAASAGRMSEQGTKVPVRTDCREELAEWLADQNDIDATCSLSGVGRTVDGENVVTELPPTQFRHLIGGQTTAGNFTKPSAHSGLVTNNHLFGTRVIDAAVMLAKRSGPGFPRIRPIKHNGQDWYVMFIAPEQAQALREEDAWVKAQSDANTPGPNNPLFRGRLGTWNRVVLFEHNLIETRLGNGSTGITQSFNNPGTAGNNLANGVMAARALLCGAQAAIYGRAAGAPRWDDDDRDFGNLWACCLSQFWGYKKTQFGGVDFGVVAVDTTIKDYGLRSAA